MVINILSRKETEICGRKNSFWIGGMTMALTEKARKMRAAMETAAVSLDDATASTAPELFPRLKGDGSLVKAGTRICWGGTLKRAAVDLWDNAENTPDAAPNLWEDLEYRDGVRIIPAVITVGKAFARDELGWLGDTLYRSKVDANVYTPEQYPANWEAADV